MVVLFRPADSCQLESVDVVDLEPSRAPGALQGPSPGLGDDGLNCEVVGESVLKDAGIELVVFVDGFEVVAER